MKDRMGWLIVATLLGVAWGMDFGRWEALLVGAATLVGAWCAIRFYDRLLRPGVYTRLPWVEEAGRYADRRDREARRR